ncbi:MAG: RloB family protein [Rickettsiales bacterium]|jgi:hypothetical protein|nr:RloB family protein [Rickettsiales bacterium]
MARNNQIILGHKNPKKIIYLACEGGASGTEWTYIKQLCDKYNCFIVPMDKRSPDPETLADIAMEYSRRSPTWRGKKSEIWIVFDNDAPAKVLAAFTKIDQYNHIKKSNCLSISIAFNAPTIETFGLLCCRVFKISGNARRNQTKLHISMPKYEHTKNPQFDFDMMESGYATAVHYAMNWQNSLAGAPEYTACPFAGIYKLTESIKK